MNKRYVLLGVLVASATGVGAFFWQNVYGWHTVLDPSGEFDVEFRFLGCDGDWPTNRPYEAFIQSSEVGSSVTYRISDPATCGYSVRQPKYKLLGDTLSMSYDLYTQSDEVAACICQYNSEFHFSTNPKAQHVVFDHSGD